MRLSSLPGPTRCYCLTEPVNTALKTLLWDPGLILSYTSAHGTMCVKMIMCPNAKVFFFFFFFHGQFSVPSHRNGQDAIFNVVFGVGE